MRKKTQLVRLGVKKESPSSTGVHRIRVAFVVE